jgi:hypothetical protein
MKTEPFNLAPQAVAEICVNLPDYSKTLFFRVYIHHLLPLFKDCGNMADVARKVHDLHDTTDYEHIVFCSAVTAAISVNLFSEDHDNDQ